MDIYILRTELLNIANNKGLSVQVRINAISGLYIIDYVTDKKGLFEILAILDDYITIIIDDLEIESEYSDYFDNDEFDDKINEMINKDTKYFKESQEKIEINDPFHEIDQEVLETRKSIFDLLDKDADGLLKPEELYFLVEINNNYPLAYSSDIGITIIDALLQNKFKLSFLEFFEMVD